MIRVNVLLQRGRERRDARTASNRVCIQVKHLMLTTDMSGHSGLTNI